METCTSLREARKSINTMTTYITFKSQQEIASFAKKSSTLLRKEKSARKRQGDYPLFSELLGLELKCATIFPTD
jgi:hypothetical protein